MEKVVSFYVGFFFVAAFLLFFQVKLKLCTFSHLFFFPFWGVPRLLSLASTLADQHLVGWQLAVGSFSSTIIRRMVVQVSIISKRQI